MDGETADDWIALMSASAGAWAGASGARIAADAGFVVREDGPRHSIGDAMSEHHLGLSCASRCADLP